MTQAATLRSVVSRFESSWAGLTPVEYPNVSFTPPNQTAWVRLSLLPGAEYQASMALTGGRIFRSAGVVDVSIFVPIGTAIEDAAALADAAAAVFRGTSFDGLVFRAPSFILVGISGGWYQTNVSIPYYRDETF